MDPGELRGEDLDLEGGEWQRNGDGVLEHPY